MAKPDIDSLAADLERTRRQRRGRSSTSVEGVGEEQAAEEHSPLRRLLSDEDRFRLVVESVDDYAIIALDASGRIAAWNDGARRVKGYDADEVLGRHFALFYPLEDIKRGKAQDELTVARESGRFEEEGWRVRKGGERYWARVILTAIRDDAGALCGFAKVTRDLTDRERGRVAVEQLARAEVLLDEARRARAEAEADSRRLRMLLDTMSDGYFTLDDQWCFVHVNASLPRLLGKTEQELIGQSFWTEVTDSVHSNFFKELPKLLTGAPQVEFRERHERTGRWYAVRAHRSDDKIAVYLRDVTAEHAGDG